MKSNTNNKSVVKLASLGLLALLQSSPISACINAYDNMVEEMLKTRLDEDSLRRELRHYRGEYEDHPSMETANDLAVMEIIAGHYEDAIHRLEELEAAHPGHAKTAANLGTVFELKGDNEKALQWIREGVARDAREHRDSEWIHVRILEAKLALASDPAWLASNRVMRIDFGDGDRPRASSTTLLDHTGRARTLQDVAQGLGYQMYERSAFVSLPDAVFADLLFSWADLVWLYPNQEDPQRLYSMAMDFGVVPRELVQRRMQEHAESNARSEPGNASLLMIGIALAACLVLTGLVAHWQRRATAVNRTVP